MTGDIISPNSGDNSERNRNLKATWRRILPRYLLDFLSNLLLNVRVLRSDDGGYPHKASQCEVPKLVDVFERV